MKQTKSHNESEKTNDKKYKHLSTISCGRIRIFILCDKPTDIALVFCCCLFVNVAAAVFSLRCQKSHIYLKIYSFSIQIAAN